MTTVIINVEGAKRVLSGAPGMTFVVEAFSNTASGRGKVAHVRDYRLATEVKPYQI